MSAAEVFVVVSASVIVVAEVANRLRLGRTVTGVGFRAGWQLVKVIVDDLRPSTRRDLDEEAASARAEADLAAQRAYNVELTNRLQILKTINVFAATGLRLDDLTADLLAAETGLPAELCAAELASQRAIDADIRRWRD